MRSYVIALILSAAAPAAFAQADARIVKFYGETCGTCHGEKGEGMKGLAPPLKGNKFVTDGSAAEIGSVIVKGREGTAKKYKDLPSPMPANSMSDARLQGLIAFLKGDLQK